MRFVVYGVLVLVLALGGVAGWLYLLPFDSPTFERIACDTLRTAGHIPEPNLHADRASAVAARGPDHPVARIVLLAAGLRYSIALALGPAALLLVAAGVVAGLRRRRLAGTASVTLAYVAKSAFALSALLYFFAALSPIGLPIVTLYASTITATISSRLYFGNLPPRI